MYLGLSKDQFAHLVGCTVSIRPTQTAQRNIEDAQTDDVPCRLDYTSKLDGQWTVTVGLQLTFVIKAHPNDSHMLQ